MFKRASDKVEAFANKIIRKSFPKLKGVRILYVLRHKPKPADGGMVVAGSVRVLSNRHRDLYGVDVEMELCTPIWNSLSKRGRTQLIDHELTHLEVLMDEDGKEYVRDKQGRIKVNTVEHDLVLKTFRSELLKFGPSKRELEIMKFISVAYRKYKKGELKVRKSHVVNDEEVDFD